MDHRRQAATREAILGLVDLEATLTQEVGQVAAQVVDQGVAQVGTLAPMVLAVEVALVVEAETHHHQGALMNLKATNYLTHVKDHYGNASKSGSNSGRIRQT